MADRLTVARPYAKAAFKQAQAEGQLGSWSEVLNAAAIAIADERVAALVGSPRVSGAQLAALLADVARIGADSGMRKLIDTLAENKRLGHLPEIAQLFDEMKDEAEGVVDVNITSAAPMAQEEQHKLQMALEKRFSRKVRLHAEVDPELIGGAVVRAGDLTIDGSYRSRLERLAYELTA